MLMVKAGPAVDELIEQLLPLLSPGDVIIDGGNTLLHRHRAPHAVRRVEGPAVHRHGRLRRRRRRAEGPQHDARRQRQAAWPLVKPIFQAIAAKVGPNDDIPCCEWVGPRGAGHYVKMVHNGIEYGDMQLICEAYFVLKQALGLTNDELYDVFDAVERGRAGQLPDRDHPRHLQRQGPGDRRLPGRHDPRHGRRKGTGKWMSQLALDLGVPSTLVTEAVYARCLSAMKEARRAGQQGAARARRRKFGGDRTEFIEQIAPGPVRLEDLQLCPGLRADAGRGQGARLAARSSARSPCCGAAAASFGPRSSIASRKPSTPTAKLENLLLAPYFTSGRRAGPDPPGGSVVATAVALGHSGAGLRRGLGLLRRLSLPSACRPTCCKPSAITSAPTPTSASTAPACSTAIGCNCASSPNELYRPALAMAAPSASRLSRTRRRSMTFLSIVHASE